MNESMRGAGSGPVALAALCGLAVALLAAACGSPEEPAVVHRYEVRGEIVRLPDPERPEASPMMIRHERIPDFKDSEGRVVGMNAMVMPFPAARGLSLEGLAPGDPVEIVFTVQWTPTTRFEVESVEALPPGTPLDFSNPPRP